MYLKQELYFKKNDKKIYGVLYLPSSHSENKVPAVIISHGFGSNCSRMEGYAKVISNIGIVVYAFDFIGGGRDIKSDGTMLDMSVLTEAEDLSIVLNGISNLQFIDKNNVFLLGNSQGGFVSTYVACKYQELVKALILQYPAFNIPYDAKQRLDNADENEQFFEVMNETISRKYGLDAITIDIFKMIKDFKKNVLILHGDKDEVVPISYSKKAVELFENAELFVIKNGEHGFHDASMFLAFKKIISFLKSQLLL